ncbi:Putative restriction endonuclease domain-containing protein, DUF820 [Desulfonema limicola]|uniref:Restriction endonuclease domain-containing protein, DUF820 n=1 Tax=Desulfonema limicola TaxID=45656 RepID=A0A975GFS1_9BACT|nr:Uma2 family endonuclease [Desulfonema limicola]QTA79601.1 Putative restriction endonuclease domain-containing protein, DUF820 [Desulfonema limicola]
MKQAQIKYISPGEYFDMEEKSAEYKSEYYHGEIFAMTGASVNHNLIAMNTGASLHALLRDSDCAVFPGDIKIQVEALHYTYPDISIVCGDIEYAGNRNDVITNPVVIIEILSKSTMDYDKGSKFTAYRNIDSLEDYILIDQYSYHVEYYHKINKMEWNFKDIKDLQDSFIIKSVNAELKLSDIYYRVKPV